MMWTLLIILTCLSLVPLLGTLLWAWAVSAGEASSWFHVVLGGVVWGFVLIAISAIDNGISHDEALTLFAIGLGGTCMLRPAYRLLTRK